MAKKEVKNDVILAEYDNIVIKRLDGKLAIIIDPAKRLGQSKSGKSTIIATTGGNKRITDGNTTLGTLGLNFYIK